MDFEQYREADLVLGSDGVNSMVRESYKDAFKPTIDMRKTKFVWLGTTQKFDAFTFISPLTVACEAFTAVPSNLSTSQLYTSFIRFAPVKAVAPQ